MMMRLLTRSNSWWATRGAQEKCSESSGLLFGDYLVVLRPLHLKRKRRSFAFAKFSRSIVHSRTRVPKTFQCRPRATRHVFPSIRISFICVYNDDDSSIIFRQEYKPPSGISFFPRVFTTNQPTERVRHIKKKSTVFNQDVALKKNGDINLWDPTDPSPVKILFRQPPPWLLIGNNRNPMRQTEVTLSRNTHSCALSPTDRISYPAQVDLFQTKKDYLRK